MCAFSLYLCFVFVFVLFVFGSTCLPCGPAVAMGAQGCGINPPALAAHPLPLRSRHTLRVGQPCGLRPTPPIIPLSLSCN
ncbi:uncharacterized protein B0H18DRAFT_444361 [Fomitopsis serialis]|uniref:uncharacterized protein n=1 Tax=Fomitopsis serialis TaxID=139415 RepID=UPI002008801B|nr:uncharacterized protein B0H18DRAFT_444361 [Neoantrodia serialis]KAH9924027.1 hypothetical protein B0H18DRAFT_444361 [Neoantrodia serialis]